VNQPPDLSTSGTRSWEYITELKLQETFQKQYVISTRGLAGAQPNASAPAEAVAILEDAPWQDAVVAEWPIMCWKNDPANFAQLLSVRNSSLHSILMVHSHMKPRTLSAFPIAG